MLQNVLQHSQPPGCLYYESQGIVDIACKIYLLAQIRAISSGLEKLACSGIRSVAGDSLRMPQPVLGAMRAHKMRFSRYTNKWNGQFTCGECGQVYERHVGDPEDQVRIIDRGATWRELLREQWGNPQIGICALADKLGVDPLTAKRQAVKLGLPFARNYKGRKARKPRPGKGSNGFPAELERQRKRWTDLMVKNPRSSRSQLRRLKSALYTWLYRHDRAWLAEVCPASVNPKRKQPRVDWEKRDIEFAEKIELAAKEMREQPDWNIRITDNKLGRRSGTHAFLHRNRPAKPSYAEGGGRGRMAG